MLLSVSVREHENSKSHKECYITWRVSSKNVYYLKKKKKKKKVVHSLLEARFIIIKMEVIFRYGRRHVDRKRERMHGDTSTTEANKTEMKDTDDSPEEGCL